MICLTLNAVVVQMRSQHIPQRPRELTDKFRWVHCTLRNETQFGFQFVDTYFDAGRYWTPPGDILPFSQTTWSACTNDLSVATGAAGRMVFRLMLKTVNMVFALVRTLVTDSVPN